MTNEQAEKEWTELVENEALKTREDWGGTYEVGLKRGIKFVRSNLSQVPELRELINRIKILKGYLKETYIEDWEPEYQAARDLESLIEKLEGK